MPENEGVENLFIRSPLSEAVSLDALCSPVAVAVAGIANIGDTISDAFSREGWKRNVARAGSNLSAPGGHVDIDRQFWE